MNKLFIVFILSSLSAHAQIDQQYDVITIENLVEQIIESNDLVEFDITDLVERFTSLANNPINLNKSSEEDFSDLLFLTTTEITSIIQHREKFGNFLSVQELQTIPNLSMDKIRMLAPFVSVSQSDSNKFNFSEILKSGQSTLFLKYKRTFQEKRGYIKDDMGNSPYVGSPNHYFTRYRFDAGRKLKAGFTMEKDPGEAFFSQNNKYGFDFYSAYVYTENLNPYIKSLALGDYTVSMGQGLIMHNAFGTGKSVYTVDIKRDGQPIRQYSSVNETNFFRGLAGTITPSKNISITGFYSIKNTNGSLNTDTTDIDDFGRFSAIARDGLHRTTSEIARKGTVTQTNFGGKFQVDMNKLSLSINHLSYIFSNPIAPRSDLYNKFNFSGDQLHATSLDYSWRFKNINTFGEVAYSHNGAKAQIHSAIVSLDRKLDLALSYRNFDRNYQTLEANAFSEGTLPFNERGLYLGVESRLNNRWKINAYLDIWKFPWLRFRVDAPSDGREFLLRVEHNVKRKYQVYLQYRFENKYQNSSTSIEKIDPIVPIYSNRMRLHLSFQLSKELQLRSRVEGSSFDKDGIRTFGYLLFQDIIYKPINSPFSGNARVSLFDTDGFDTRIYTFENDLLYEFLIPFFQGQGVRSYINFRYRILRNLGWEFKLARTILLNADSIGSGNETILGNRRTEFKTQIKYTF